MQDTQNTREMSMSEREQLRPLWKNRDYLLLVSGLVISTTGSQFSLIAFPLLALFISGSPAQAGLIGSMRLVPYLLLSLPAGALSDRWDRKRVMQICDAGRGLSLASIPIAFALGHLTLLQLYLVSFIEGTLFVFFDLAEVACLPRVVPREQVMAATAQNELGRNLAFLLGPALGGAIYSLGKFLPFLLDACSYVISVCSLGLIRAQFQQERSAERKKLWSDIREGLFWLWHQPLLFFIACTGAFIHLVFDGAPLLLIVLAQQLHTPPFLIGLIVAMDGVGSTFGAVLASRFGKNFSFRALFVTCHWLWAMLWLTILFAHTVLVLCLILGLVYTSMMIADLTQFSYRRLVIPDALQGRVNSVFRLIAYSGGPVGMALVGLFLQLWGPYITIGIIGVGGLLIALLVTLNPHVRCARSLHELEREHLETVQATTD